MFSGRGGSRNYRISGRGGGPSLTDVLVIFYLLLQFQLTIPRELKFPRGRVGESKFVGAVG